MAARILIVADDLTGANAAAAGFARAGLRTVTVSHGQPLSTVAEFAARFDVIVVDINCRHDDPAEAARRAGEVVHAGWPSVLVCNRIDTTLRGNVAATTQAVATSVAELSGHRVVALCAPAHPGADRQTVDGMQLLRGRRLEDTELATDPLNPMRTSEVAALVSAGTPLRTASVGISEVTTGGDVLIWALHEGMDTADVVVADALTQDHLDSVARAAVAAKSPDTVLIGVDPGPGSLALARAAGLLTDHRMPPVLVVSGSATAHTRAQLRRLVHARDTRVVPIALSPDRRLDRTVTGARLADALGGSHGVVLLATAVDDSDLVPMTAAQSAGLSVDLAATVRTALDAGAVAGLCSIGGDLTAHLLAALGAQGLEVETEIEPLVVAGGLVGGPWNGLSVATKGGLVGGPGIVDDCVERVQLRAEATRHHVPAAETVHRDSATTSGGL